MVKKIRIGTRGSPLAMAQARYVEELINASLPAVETSLVPITTSGDRMKRVALWKVGGKGLFIKEIEQALQNGAIDVAVHSMKDLPHPLTGGLVIGAVPKREDPRDAVIAHHGASGIEELPPGVVVGTSSLRRKAQLLSARPDLAVMGLRGNVGTRIRKVAEGTVDAVILAVAGLLRLNETDVSHCPLSPDRFLPAAGQGALAVQVRQGEEGMVRALTDEESERSVLAERTFISALGADCHSAVGAYAKIENGTLTLFGGVFPPDGKEGVRGEYSGSVDGFLEVGEKLAEELLGRGAKEILMLPEQ
jgi:hydroxymethylbilane synthase